MIVQLCDNCEENLFKRLMAKPSSLYRVRKMLIKLYGDKCLKCGVRYTIVNGRRRDLCIDHVIPISKGGLNDISNFQLLCSPCNSGKKDRLGKKHDYRK